MLSTGVIGDGLTCHKAEEIGLLIHEKLDTVSLSQAKIKRKDALVGFNQKISSVNVDDKPFSVNSTLLFTRLSALAGREENVEKYFEYELTSYPMSLFKEGLMRKPYKSLLKNAVLSKEVSSSISSRNVVDGGLLLQQVNWPRDILFVELITHYVTSVRNRYGSCHVVFDGYDIASVKDHEHMRRSS